MKNKKLIIFASALIAIAVFCLFYTRPVTIEELSGFNLDNCLSIKTFHSVFTKENKDLSQIITGDFSEESIEFKELKEEFSKIKFKKSLKSFLPKATKSHALNNGDFKWNILFEFKDVKDNDGNTGSGYLLEIENFYGKLYIKNNAKDKLFRISAIAPTGWEKDILDIINK